MAGKRIKNAVEVSPTPAEVQSDKEHDAREAANMADHQPLPSVTPHVENGHYQGNGYTKKKHTCPKELTLQRFMGNAKDMTVELMGVGFNVKKKAFSTGSFGWFDQKNVEECSVDGVQNVTLHIQLTITVCGSKEAARS